MTVETSPFFISTVKCRYPQLYVSIASLESDRTVSSPEKDCVWRLDNLRESPFYMQIQLRHNGYNHTARFVVPRFKKVSLWF